MNAGKLIPIVVCLLGALVVGGCARTTYTVTSDPPGAMIYVNRHPYGVTPRTVSYRNQRRRDAVFIVRKQGYKEQEQTLSALGGSAHFVLEPVDGPARKPEPSVPVPPRPEAPPEVTGDIMVNTGQEGAELYVDGSFVGNAPADLKLDEGTHVIEVRKAGYIPYRRELRVLAGSKVVLDVALETQAEVAQQEIQTPVAEPAETTEEQVPTAVVPSIPPPATKPTTARQVNLVCVEGDNPIAGKEIWLSYYDEDARRWVIENRTTDEEGSVLFEVPQGKPGGSSTFTFAFSETEVKTRGDEIERGERLGLRIPPDPTQTSVTVSTDSKLNASVIDGVVVPSRPDGREAIESDASLLKAALAGDTFIVKALLDVGADVDTRDRNAQTPLMAAASKSHMEGLEALLAAGANVNAQRVDGQTALISAAIDGRAEVAHVLLAHGADPNLSTERGTTALIGAAYKGNTQIVQALLAAGADADAKEKDGQTALMGAAYKGHTEIVRILLAAGADASIAKNDGGTALAAALEAGNDEIVQLIKATAAEDQPTPPLEEKPAEEVVSRQPEPVADDGLPPFRLSLYVAEKGQLSQTVDHSFSVKYYLYGGPTTQEWAYPLRGERLTKDGICKLLLASLGTTELTVSLTLKGENKQDKTLVKDSFTIDAKQYKPRWAKFAIADESIEGYDQLVLALTASGSNWGMLCGEHRSSVAVLEPTTPLPEAVATEREKALGWALAHIRWGPDSDVMRNFAFELDGVILTERNAQWGVGSNLTVSGRPFNVRWVDGEFRVRELSEEEASERELGESSLHFETLSSEPQETESTQVDPLHDDAPFLAAQEQGTKEAWTTFLSEFPGHQREADARAALQDLEGRNIVDLLSEKKIEIETSGSGIQNIRLKVRRLVPHPITVTIPVGTYFVSQSPSSQNMVTTAEKKLTLRNDDWLSTSPPAACANRSRDIPGDDDSFTVRRSAHQEELARLMPVLEKARASYAVRQAAVWIVTDNADYGDLGILISRPAFQPFGGTRQIREPETAQAMRICEEAGMDITGKAIWGDREKILAGLEEGDLKTWLEQKQ